VVFSVFKEVSDNFYLTNLVDDVHFAYVVFVVFVSRCRFFIVECESNFTSCDTDVAVD